MGGVTTAHRRCTLRDTKLHVVTYQKTSTSQKILVFLSFLTHKTLSIKSSVRSPCRYIQLCRVYSTSGVIRFIFALHNLYENRSRNISIVLNTARPLWGRKRRRRKKGGGAHFRNQTTDFQNHGHLKMLKLILTTDLPKTVDKPTPETAV